jgi:hypothetical protein
LDQRRPIRTTRAPGPRAAAALSVLILFVLAPEARRAEAQGPGGADPDLDGALSPRLEADRLELSRGGGVRARGRARIGLGRCSLRAGELRLAAGGLLEADGALLEDSRVRLRARRFRLGPDGSLAAEDLEGSLCRCGEDVGALLSIGARRALVRPGGRRLHLVWPDLRILGRRVFALPYFALPLARAVSGLFFPEIGYSPRDGVRLTQGGYLALSDTVDLEMRAGYIQHRGAVGTARARYFTEERGDGELQATGLLDGDRPRGAVRGRLALRGRSFAVVATPDLVSDPDLPRELERDPARALAQHARSRLAFWAGRGPLTLAAWADLDQELRTPLRHGRSASGTGSLEAALLPTRILGPVAVELLGRATVLGPGGLGPEDPDATLAARGAPELLGGALALAISPAILLGEALGPVRISGILSYRLAGILVDDPSPKAPGGGEARRLWHQGLARLEASVPLARIFVSGPGGAGEAGASPSRIRHELEPFAALAWTEASPGWAAEPLGLAPLVGLWGAAGIRTVLHARRGTGPVRRLLALELRADLPLAGSIADPEAARREPLLGGDLEVDLLAGFSARGELRVGLSEGGPTARVAEAELCRRGERLRACLGYSRLRLAETRALFPESGFVFLEGLSLPIGSSSDEIHGSLSVILGPVEAAATLAVNPVLGRVDAGVYSLDFVLGCGCYRVGLLGYSRATQSAPDLFARFSIAPTSWGCQARSGSFARGLRTISPSP